MKKKRSERTIVAMPKMRRMCIFHRTGLMLLVAGLVLSMERKSGGMVSSCDLCKDNWLLILGAHGRTGSTTALATFKAIPGFEIAGEHWGALNEIHTAYVKIMDADTKHGVAAFVGRPLDHGEVLCVVQDFVRLLVYGKDRRKLENSTKILGFKEVKYMNNLSMLEFLHRVFPCARMVFTVRDDENATLKARGFDAQTIHQDWARSRELAFLFHATFPNRSAILAVESLTLQKYNDILYHILGVRNCSYVKIVSHNLGGTYTGSTSANVRPLEGTCDLSNVDFRLTEEQLKAQKQSWEELKQKWKTMTKE